MNTNKRNTYIAETATDVQSIYEYKHFAEAVWRRANEKIGPDEWVRKALSYLPAGYEINGGNPTSLTWRMMYIEVKPCQHEVICENCDERMSLHS